MNPTVMALRKGGIRYDSGTDLVRKTLSASASDSGLAQIVQVRVVPCFFVSSLRFSDVPQSNNPRRRSSLGTHALTDAPVLPIVHDRRPRRCPTRRSRR